MNALIVIAGIISLAFLVFLHLVARSHLFVRPFCLTPFQERQQKFLIKFNNDSRIINVESKDKITEVMIETLQEYLWDKSKELDEGISKRTFSLETILDIAYIAWLIYFINKNNDVGKP